MRRGEEREKDANYWEEDLLYTCNQVQCGTSSQQNVESEKAHSQTKLVCSPTHQKDWLNCTRKTACYSPCQQLQYDSQRKSSSIGKTCRPSTVGCHSWRKMPSASFHSRSLDLFLYRVDLLRKKGPASLVGNRSLKSRRKNTTSRYFTEEIFSFK